MPDLLKIFLRFSCSSSGGTGFSTTTMALSSVAALDEVGLDEGLQLVEEDERAARRDFRCVVVAGLEGGILVADDLGIVIDVQRNGKLVVGVEDDGHALSGMV